MGIKGLTKLINENAPSGMKETSVEAFTGRTIAIDASMIIYQFVSVVGRMGDQVLTDEAGEITSHLQGLFFRTIRMIEKGIKPVFVFDGKPPDLKSGEIAGRREKREAAEAKLAEAKEAGDEAEIEKMSKRMIKVTPQMNDECKRLLRLMGMPIVQAPSEAEAQCAELCKKGLVYAVSSEDMDTLTFGAPRLVRYLMEAEGRKLAVLEFDLAKVIEGFDLTMEQFVDVCILCGSDYTDSIRGIGPESALKLIREHKSLEAAIPVLESAMTHKTKDKESKLKYTIPENFPYREAAAFFMSPEVTDGSEVGPLKRGKIDEEGIIEFMVREKSFNETRIRSGIEKLKKQSNQGAQARLDSFFKPSGSQSFAPLKRKDDKGSKKPDAKKAKLKQKGKGKGVGKR